MDMKKRFVRLFASDFVGENKMPDGYRGLVLDEEADVNGATLKIYSVLNNEKGREDLLDIVKTEKEKFRLKYPNHGEAFQRLNISKIASRIKDVLIKVAFLDEDLIYVGIDTGNGLVWYNTMGRTVEGGGIFITTPIPRGTTFEKFLQIVGVDTNEYQNNIVDKYKSELRLDNKVFLVQEFVEGYGINKEDFYFEMRDPSFTANTNEGLVNATIKLKKDRVELPAPYFEDETRWYELDIVIENKNGVNVSVNMEFPSLLELERRHSS